jgi:hypothetical protein
MSAVVVVLAHLASRSAWSQSRRGVYQQGPVDRLLAQVYYEFLQGHGLVVDRDEQVA